MKAQKFVTCNENKVKDSQKSDVNALFWHFWACTGHMDAQRHNNKCYLIGWHSHKVVYEHQELLEKTIKHKNRAVAWQREAPYGGTDTVAIEDTEIRSSRHTAQILARVIMMFLVYRRHF